MADITTGSTGKTLMKYVGPFLIGALLSMLLSLSGDRQELRRATKDIEDIRAKLSYVEQSYATNKRVDDLQNEMRAGFSKVDGKLDDVLKLLLQLK